MHDYSPFEFGQPRVKIGLKKCSCISKGLAIQVNKTESIFDFLFESAVVGIMSCQARKNCIYPTIEGINYKSDCSFTVDLASNIIHQVAA